jgi:hypothetical protein
LKLATSMAIPRRSSHGTAVLSGAVGGDRLLIFGGEGEPTLTEARKSTSDEGLAGPAMLNDLWSVQLASGEAANLIATEGVPPMPRTHHTLAVLKDPPPPKAKLAASRMKKHGLAQIMGRRAASMASAPACARHTGYGTNSSYKPGAARPAAGGVVLSPGKGRSAPKSPSNGVHWTVLIIGGRTANHVPESSSSEDALHVLRLSESGDVRWVPALQYLQAAVRKRLQQERTRAESHKVIREHFEREQRDSPPASPRGTPQPPNSPPPRRGVGNAARAASAVAEADLEAACRAGRASFALLQRQGHSTVVSGSVAIVFGGIHSRAAKNDLVSVRFRDLATALLPSSGTPPPARHSHAATFGAGGMLVCGGLNAGRIFDDVYHLSIPQVAWSTIRLPAIPGHLPLPDAVPGAPLARHGHGIAQWMTAG